MKNRIAATLLALALPLTAQADQAPAAAQVESTFYKAYYLEKGKRDFEGAMVLYANFLAKAPEHKLAGEAAKQHFRLLDRTGKTKQRDAFKAKYSKLLGKVANASTRPARGAADAEGGRPQRGARGERGQGGQRGQRGGQRGGMRGMMTLLRGETKIADMSKEQLEQLKEGVKGSASMIDRMRQFMGEEVADKLEKSSADLQKALDAGKMEDAQKALEALKTAFPQGGARGGRGGRGGEEGGQGGRRRRGGNRGEAEAGKKPAGGGGKKTEGGGGGR